MRITTVPSSIRKFALIFVANKRERSKTVSQHAELTQVVHQLEALNQSTEQDFLVIGARLMEFLSDADRIATSVGSVIQTTSKEQGPRASAVLEQALGRCRRLIATTTQSRGRLACLRNEAVQVANIFGGFRQAVASFHVVCTMTRIEVARLGGAGTELGSLTEDVLALAHRMEAHVQRVLEAATAVDRQVEQIAEGLRGTNKLLDHLALTTPHVLRSLEAFSAQQASAASLSAQLALDSRSVSHAMMDAVTSIQFHDITRQQIEHVTAALEHLAAWTTGTAHPHEMAAALELEAMQLASASDTFDASVTRLWTDLEGIATSVKGMAAPGEVLLAGCGNDSLFLLEMQHCLDAIAEAVTTHDASACTTRQSAQALATTLDAMNEAAAEIRELDVQLLRVALNANIRAAHLGPRGETLAVLASALQDLAGRAQERSRQAATALDTMGSAVKLLVAPSGEDDDATLTASMRATVHALKDASEAGSACLGEVASSASKLAEGIAAARIGFRAGRLFAEAVPACLSQLHAIAATVATQAATSPAEGRSDALETFARQYTMQSERLIHASATESSMPMPVLVAAGDTELGDNVELF